MSGALPVALAAASAFAVGAVMEHRAASSAPVDRGASGPLRLLAHLVRDPRWLLAIAVGATAIGLQGLALHLGTVVTVQPVLASGLVISLVLGFLVDRRHPGRPLPGRRQWAAAGVVVLGLATFLVSADPAPGSSERSQGALVVLVAGALSAAVVAVLYSRLPGARRPAMALGAAAGSAFGVNSLMLKALVEVPFVQWSTSWQTLAVVVLGATGVGVSQLAYQAGPLVQSLPVLTVVEPLVALGSAGPVFGEWLAPGWGPHTAQGAGVALLLGGLVLLALGQAAPAPGAPTPPAVAVLPLAVLPGAERGDPADAEAGGRVQGRAGAAGGGIGAVEGRAGAASGEAGAVNGE